MNITPFRMEDLDTFIPGERELSAVPTGQAMISERFVGEAVSVIDNGITIGIAGVTVDDGIPRASVMLSDLFRDRPIVLHRMAARGLKAVMDYFKFDTMEAEVKDTDTIGKRWAERLGFKPYSQDGLSIIYRFTK